MTAIHTALDIRPAYEPKSYAEIVAADKERERKWRAAAQKRPVVRAEVIERQPERNEPEAPVERIWPRQYDAHVRSFLEWKGNEPLGWLKLRCRELELSFDDIIGNRRFVTIVEKRKQLIREVKERFPNMSLPAIGRLFGGRDHTTILWVLGGSVDKPQRHQVDEASVVALLNTGMRQKDIADRLNVSPSVICRINAERCQNRSKRRSMKDYTDQIRALFDSGITFSEIGAQTEFDPSAISKFVKRMDWKR